MEGKDSGCSAFSPDPARTHEASSKGRYLIHEAPHPSAFAQRNCDPTRLSSVHHPRTLTFIGGLGWYWSQVFIS